MEKPISMVIEETKTSIINIINKSQLHPSIIELMLKEIYLEANIFSNEILQNERKQFIDGMTKETNDELRESTIK